jgi:hypothetical protein
VVVGTGAVFPRRADLADDVEAALIQTEFDFSFALLRTHQRLD